MEELEGRTENRPGGARLGLGGLARWRRVEEK